MDISVNGLTIIKCSESFQSRLYNCPAGHCTVGYGHLVHMGPIDGRECEQPFVHGINYAEGTELLKTDCRYAEHAMDHLITVPLNQNQFDALVSWTFNLGAGTLQRSTLLKILNQKNYAAVPAEMKKYIYANHQPMAGLVYRRNLEAALFVK